MQQTQSGYLRILFVYNGIFILAGNLLGPLYGVYMEHLRGSITLISISWMVLLASTTVFSMLLATVSHRLNKETLLLAGYLTRACAWTAFMFIGSATSLIILQVILGLGDALGTPAFDAMLAEKTNPDNRIADYARGKFIANVFTAVGVGIGGIIVATFGFPPLFGLMAVLAMVSFFGVYLHSHPIRFPQAIPFVLEYVPEYHIEDRED